MEDEADIYGLLTAQDEGGASLKAQALAAALRRQKQIGSVLAMHPLLAKQGQMQFGDAQNQEQQLAQAAPQRLTMALQKQKQAAGAAELGFDNAPANDTYTLLAKKFGVNLPQGMTNIQAQQVLGMAEKAYAADQRAKELQLNRWAMSQTRGDARQAKEDARVDKDIKELSEDMTRSGAPGFYQQSAVAEGLAAKHPDDLPGFGTFAGMLPDWAPGISDDAIQLRQAVGQMLAEYRKGITGAGMSDAERAEYGRITGLIQSGNEKSVRLGMTQLRDAVDARTASRVSGSIPAAAKEFAKRQPWVGEVLKRAGGQQPGAAVPAGKVRIRLPNGAVKIIPADKQEEAVSKFRAEVLP